MYGLSWNIFFYSFLCLPSVGQYNRIANKIQILQNKTLRIMNFCPKNATTTPLYHCSKILKLVDHIKLQNFLYAYDQLRKNLPKSMIDERFKLSNRNRRQQINQLDIIRTNTILYGSKSIKSQSINTWNSINLHLHNMKLQGQNRTTCKIAVTKYLMDNINLNH